MEERPRSLHVMVVDDDPLSLDLAGAWLRSAGHRVTLRTAAVGTAADVIALRPDVALFDVVMPGLRGDDLARLLKRHPATQGLPVILFSALPNDKLRPLIMTSGALGAIEKTPSQAVFLFAFNCLMAKVPVAMMSNDSSASWPAASSGTYRVADAAPATPTRGGRKVGG